MLHKYKHVNKIDEREMDAIIVKINFFKNANKTFLLHYRKTQNFEIGKKNKPFSLMSQGHLKQKIRFLALKM